MTIDDMKIGEEAKIISLDKLPQYVARKLLDLGFIRGEKVIFVNRAPLGDPLWVEVKGYQLSFRKEFAQCIEVEAL